MTDMPRVLALGLVAGLCVLPCCSKGSGSREGESKRTDAARSPGQTVSRKVKVEFFVMSQCPYGVQVEQGIGPVMDKMGGDVDLTIDFIGEKAEGKLASMHGDSEVNGDKVQLCAMKHFPARALAFINCMNTNPGSIPGNWEGCAKEIGLDAARMRTCYEGPEGAKLLEASFDKALARKASGSPTIFMNGEPYYGARSEMSFTRAVCAAFPEDRPALCASLPPPVKVSITIVADRRCKECSAKLWKGYMQGPFPDAEFTVYEYTEKEGKEFYDDIGLTMLPAVLFRDEVEKADNYLEVKRFLHPRGDYLELDIGATFDPEKEICDNERDDTGDGRADCDDEDCAKTLTCRKEMPRRLDLFVMSQCPYGMAALDSMAEVLENFGSSLEFQVNYIATAKGDGFESMHGQAEVDEDIRELCAIKKYGKSHKYMDYILCRNKKMGTASWEECTGGNGIDAKVIEKCFAGEGKDLLRENLKVAEGLGINSSPTWLANSKFPFPGPSPDDIKTQMCKHNKDLPNCAKKLTGLDAAPAGPGPGACGN